jgi:hypothetical protein
MLTFKCPLQGLLLAIEYKRSRFGQELIDSGFSGHGRLEQIFWLGSKNIKNW